MADTTSGSRPAGFLIPLDGKSWASEPQYPIGDKKIMIGRAPSCDVQINHPTVSRLHAELNWADGRPILTHLSAVNLTRVNGIPARGSTPLHTGDLIEIADGIMLRLELRAGGDDETLMTSRHDRRMYAILYADVVGYSRLIEDDDMATARELDARLGIIRLETEGGKGRIVNIAGDGILLLFPSTEAAVSCAVSCQQIFAERNEILPPARRMVFRIGINSGDVLFTPTGGMHGDAINIAARIQTLAPPGGILITGVVYDQLQGKEGLRFEPVKIGELKNISREVRAYHVVVSRS